MEDNGLETMLIMLQVQDQYWLNWSNVKSPEGGWRKASVNILGVSTPRSHSRSHRKGIKRGQKIEAP